MRSDPARAMIADSVSEMDAAAIEELRVVLGAGSGLDAALAERFVGTALD